MKLLYSAAIILPLGFSLAAGSSLSQAIEKARTAGSLRLAWMGTSITCGMGASGEDKQFPVRVAKLFEQRAGAKVVSRNLCFGGAHSLLQVALLKEAVLPWKPDIIIAELGTLDEFYAPLSLPAIEAFLRIARRSGIPVIAIYPYTRYAPVARDGLGKLTAAYGDCLIDMLDFAAKRQASLELTTTDGAHPNDVGEALIEEAFLDTLRSDSSAGSASRSPELPTRTYSPDFSGVRFLPVFIDNPAARVARYFGGRGYALRISADRVITQPFRGTLIGLLFQLNGVPQTLNYRIDGGEWSDVPIAPGWFLNYILRPDLKNTAHSIELRIVPKANQPVILEGFFVNDGPVEKSAQE